MIAHADEGEGIVVPVALQPFDRRILPARVSGLHRIGFTIYYFSINIFQVRPILFISKDFQQSFPVPYSANTFTPSIGMNIAVILIVIELDNAAFVLKKLLLGN